MKRIVSFLLAIVLVFSNQVMAVSQSDLDSINDSIESKKDQKNEVTAEKKTVMEEVEDLIYQISDYESQIEALDNELDDLEDKIAESEANIAKEEQNYEELNASAQERITAVYEAGETTFLDMLLGSNSLMDFISNYYLASLVTEADAEMLEEIERKK